MNSFVSTPLSLKKISTFIVTCWVVCSAAFLSAQSISYTLPFDVPLLQLEQGASSAWLQITGLTLAFCVFFHYLRLQRFRWALFLIWLYASCSLTFTFWWLYISMHVYGGLASPIAATALVLFTSAVGLIYLLFFIIGVGIFKLLKKNSKIQPLHAAPTLPHTLLFGLCWSMAELARAQWFTGFPWGHTAYAHIDGFLSVLAPWVGVYVIGLVSTTVCTSFAFIIGVIITKRHLPLRQNLHIKDGAKGIKNDLKEYQGHWILMGCFLIVLTLTLGAARHWQKTLQNDTTLDTHEVQVRLLQSNVAQDTKFTQRAVIADSLRWHYENLAPQRAWQKPTLTITPETALPILKEYLPLNYWESLADAYGQSQHAAMVGIPALAWEPLLPSGNTTQENANYVNAIFGFSAHSTHAQDTPYRYAKTHLVPFGEFVPPLFAWFVRAMDIPLGDFATGGAMQPSFAWQKQILLPTICYEDLFGEDFAERISKVSANQRPTILVNMSNIAWFGNTSALPQHLAISRMRALEFDRPVLRATNTGSTAHITHTGAVIASLPPLTRGVLESTVTGRKSLTPYAQWVGRWGLKPLWALYSLILSLYTVVGLAVLRKNQDPTQ